MRGRTDRPFTISHKPPLSNRSSAALQRAIKPTSNSFIDQKLIEGAQRLSLLTKPYQEACETYNPETKFPLSQNGDELQLDAFDLELLARPDRTTSRIHPSYTERYFKAGEPPRDQTQKEGSRFFCLDSQITPQRNSGSSSSDVDIGTSSSPLVRLHKKGRTAIPVRERDLDTRGISQDFGTRILESGPPHSHLNSSELSSIAGHHQNTPFQNIPTTIRSIVLLSVRELPDNYRSLFHFPVFNAVQSKCFQHIYETDDNVVLSAPTGSGKTVVMELAVCRLLSSLKDERFKVVYQAPTKSLCSERFRDWNRKFNSLGLQCTELTGDTDHTQLRNVQNSQIIITTPEKWDSMTRKWKDHARLMQLVKLFLIDEVHTLKEARGSTLEAVVSRMKSIGSNVRFVALSATIPNSEDIATWLGRNATSQHIPAHREHFGEEFRPVKLQRYVYGYQSHSNDFAFDKICNSKLPDVISTHSCKKPIMIFCCTRNSAVGTAKELARLWSMCNPPARLWKGPSKPMGVHNVDLKTTISAGVAFHHAGLDPSDRHQVENGFLQGQISIICCTSTLAVGVNLPCHLVIIKNTVGWQDGCCQEYSDLEIMQMLGRAGRPQFDDSATAVILTRKERVSHYEKLVSGSESLESCLHLNLIDHLNAEIGLGNVTSIESAIHWLAGTFLFVRLRRNPAHYRLKEGANREDEDEMLRQICEKDVKLLQECGLVSSEGLRSTAFGDSMARYYIQFETMKTFLTLESHPSVSQILSVMVKAEEFRDLRLKAGEKSLYKEINRASGISFPVEVDIALPAHKISLLIQSELGAIEFPAGEQFQKHKFPFQQDKTLVFSHVNRLIRCIIDCQIHRQDSVAVRNALELSRSLGARVWDNSPLQMKQIEQIGIVAVRKLTGAGIESIEALDNTEAHQIDMILSKNPPFGVKVLTRLAEFPKLRVSVKMTGKDIKPGTSVRVPFKAEIGFMNEKCPTYFQRRPVHVCFFVGTSDGRLVDFRRISASKIQNSHEILLSSELKQPGQRITCYVMADGIAGTLRWATLKPDFHMSLFPPQSGIIVEPGETLKDGIQSRFHNETFLPTSTTSHNVDVFDSDDSIFGDFLEAERVSTDEINIDPKPRNPSKNTAQGKPAEVSRRAEGMASIPKDVEKEPVQLENGRWACNHKCKDKLTCKHFCCRDGLSKQPKPSKKRTDGGSQGTTGFSQLTLSGSISKGTHVIPVVKTPNEGRKKKDRCLKNSARNHSHDLPILVVGDETEKGDTYNLNSKSLSDYGDDSLDDLPSPSALFGISMIPTIPLELQVVESKPDTEDSEFGGSWLDTDNTLFPIQSPLVKPMKNDKFHPIDLLSPEPQQQTTCLLNTELTALDIGGGQRGKRSFTEETQFEKHKKAKSSEVGQRQSFHTKASQLDPTELASEGSHHAPQPSLPQPFEVPSDLAPVDIEELDSELLKDFMNVVDFF